ncbi:hypothetical protein, partial [Methylophaga sp.]|uniref:hypothetical protein n=1 Tax=Methylophaga sp. TaxID=2024840 RepID=UPI00272BBBC0
MILLSFHRAGTYNCTLANVTFTALFPKLPITGYSMSTPENDTTPSFAELGLAAPILQAVQQ